MQSAIKKLSSDELMEGIRAKLALYQQNVGRAEFRVSEQKPSMYIQRRVKKEIPKEVEWLG